MEGLDKQKKWFRLKRQAEKLNISLDQVENLLSPTEPHRSHVESNFSDSLPALARYDELAEKIQTCVKNQDSWAQIFSLTKSAMAIKFDLDLFARVIEICVLSNHGQDLSELLEGHHEAFSHLVVRLHNEIRPYFWVKLTQSEQGKLKSSTSLRYSEYLYQDPHAEWINDQERVLIFLHMVMKNQKRQAKSYLLQYQNQLIEGAKQIKAIDLKFESFILTGIGLYLEPPFEIVKSQELLSLLSRHSLSYQEASLMITSTQKIKTVFDRKSLEKEGALYSIPQKLLKLESLISQAYKENSSSKSCLIHTLNQIKDLILSLETYSFSDHKLVSRYFIDALKHKKIDHQDYILDSAILWFSKRSLVTFDEDSEWSIWEAVQELDGTDIWSGLLKAISNVHLYLRTPDIKNECLAFEAFLTYQSFEGCERGCLPSWDSLHSFAIRHLARLPDSLIKQQSLRLWSILMPVQDILDIELESYIKTLTDRTLPCPISHLRVWESRLDLHTYPQARQILLSLTAKHHYLTNYELEDFVTCSRHLKDYDAAIRAISIRISRGQSKSEDLELWKFSGENRYHYPLITPDIQMLALATLGYDEEVKKQIHILFKLGGKLTENFSFDELEPVIQTWAFHHSQDHQALDQVFQNCIFTANSHRRKMILTKKGIQFFTLPLISVYPQNITTAVVLYLSSYLGFHNGVKNLSPYLNRLSGIETPKAEDKKTRRLLATRPHSTKVIEYNLQPFEEKAWHDLKNLTPDNIDPEFENKMIMCLLKIATLVCGHHCEALQTMHSMNLGLKDVREFEHWILSHGYQEWRRKKNLLHTIDPYDLSSS